MKQETQSRPAATPSEFLSKMRRLLGDEEYAQFAACFGYKAHAGLRVNTLKLSTSDYIELIASAQFSVELAPVGDFEPAGFRILGDYRLGNHPYHAAGLFYLQEPSAMIVASMMQPQPGELVLDLAAAPGGKSTHLACLMKNEGLLVANDVNQGRTSLLAQNLERWGARNTLILNDTPERLADALGPVFDKVLLDAPCSGEGMFRRKDDIEWSDRIVAACASRQNHILSHAARLVRPGGLLAYATCTFSAEENEDVIGRFLARHEDYALIEGGHYDGFAPGRPDWIADDSPAEHHRQRLERALRIWPHRFPGEGHFLALLRRADNKRPLEYARPQGLSGPSAAALRQWREFASDYLRVDFPGDRLIVAKNRLYLLPERSLRTAELRVVRYGLFLGELRRGYFRPAHTLAMTLTPAEVHEHVNWTADSAEVSRYLQGESFAVDGPDGWVLVAVDGYALGWGKRVANQLKNHYPRGLRHLASVDER